MPIKITKLRDETREMFLNRSIALTPADIAEKIGVSVSWVNSFGRGSIKEPSVNTIESLNHVLKAHAKKASA